MSTNAVTSAVIFLSVFSVSFAAVGFGPATVHESHPDQCYNEKSKSYFSPGDSWQLEGCGMATCSKFKLSASDPSDRLMVSFESCGLATVQSPCYLVQDNTKSYPDCCHQVVCPESGEDENEMFKTSEELSSGMNRSSSSSSALSANDLAGSAVHFSLAQDEDNAVDRSERNDLQSLEEAEQDNQDLVGEDESFELIQPRRIPFRFQFAHFYDIGSDHEQRLNDVDAQEDYQLV